MTLVNGEEVEVVVSTGRVGVIVVKIDSVVWMTDDPLVVIGVVTTTTLVKGVDFCLVEGGDGVIVVKMVRENDITDEPLVV